MLGKLARWLRIIGYDTILATNEKDSELKRIAKEENRIVLTRDASITGSNVVHVPEDLEDQLVFLAKTLGLEIPEGPVPRFCPVCNGKLIPTNSGLPPGIEKGWKCQKCGKVYWGGSHWKRMRVFLARVRSKIENQE